MKTNTVTTNVASTGFFPAAVDEEFACRSARYLASQGYQAHQITSALIEQLDLSKDRATNIVSALAA